MLGGIGIFPGLFAGFWLAVAAGAARRRAASCAAILGGCAILFVAGLLDDLSR